MPQRESFYAQSGGGFLPVPWMWSSGIRARSSANRIAPETNLLAWPGSLALAGSVLDSKAIDGSVGFLLKNIQIRPQTDFAEALILGQSQQSVSPRSPMFRAAATLYTL
ncbi:uncharacterized protein CTRU02_200328 [Colletotrichum truncatum]|uniref:Uncharacterized protein n=1 Tax=Colletotrichum truncatum TaxID=5467 RepID=A0ACC3ZEV0_COLTU|nr:uncharacterized protein CTRU02_00084 [Colletotrichum truncatum]KAF6801335.1 hypothetical protein CTRU02_00084 [Colletotrichum truncatum]